MVRIAVPVGKHSRKCAPIVKQIQRTQMGCAGTVESWQLRKDILDSVSGGIFAGYILIS